MQKETRLNLIVKRVLKIFLYFLFGGQFISNRFYFYCTYEPAIIKPTVDKEIELKEAQNDEADE